MPLATIHLISLQKSTNITSFLQNLASSSVQPLVVSRVVRWIITPENIDIDPLLHPPKPWDLLLILPSTSPLPSTLLELIDCSWTTVAGVPSRLTKDFAKTNDTLLHPEPNSLPNLTGSLDNPRIAQSSQTLELSPDLQSWITEFSKTHAGRNAVSMLNLLAFKPGMKDSYLTYGKAFAEDIGQRRGGTAKLVGDIVKPESRKSGSKQGGEKKADLNSWTENVKGQSTAEEKDLSSWTENVRGHSSSTSDARSQSEAKSSDEWDEFALAHYPSILHFADMLASEDYQSVNLKYRVPALKDTCILCTSEIDIEQIWKERKEGNSGDGVGIGRRAAAGSKL